MDPELSLLMANLALARANSLIYDPFVGTGSRLVVVLLQSGSFLMTCSEFGAYTIGSDIDGREIRGNIHFKRFGSDKPNGDGVRENLIGHNLHHRLFLTAVFDITRHPLRTGEWFDAIVTDRMNLFIFHILSAPYGVRAGAKKIGGSASIQALASDLENVGLSKGAVESASFTPKYPHTVPYEMSEILTDLLAFSAEYLRVGGRLVYWLPTITERFSFQVSTPHPSTQDTKIATFPDILDSLSSPIQIKTSVGGVGV